MGYIEKKKSTNFNICGSCNQKCTFCSGYPKINFKIDNIKSKIKGLKEISLQGGEPTLSPFLFDILDYARLNGTKNVNLITNGIKIADYKFASKLSGKIDCYHFAFMSHKKLIADVLGGSENTLKLKSKGILNLIKLGQASKIRLVHIIQQDNIDDLQELPLFISKRFSGVNLIEFKYIQYFGNKNNLGKLPKYTNIINIINDTFKICKKLGINFIINGIPLCFLEEKFHKYSASYYNENNDEQMKKYSTIKLNKCNDCNFFKHCIGIRQDYLLLNGDNEFR